MKRILAGGLLLCLLFLRDNAFLLIDEPTNCLDLDAREMSLEKFYSDLKSGIDSKTVQINTANFIDYFEPHLKKGKDINSRVS